jgi:uncharacterized protein (DUF1800 family)
MGDANTVLTTAEARHLLRRTGFGANPKDVAKMVGRGLTRGQAADELLSFKPKKVKLDDDDFENAVDRWILYMVKAKAPLQEKLVLFWHDHFATAITKVQSTHDMVMQNALLRRECKGNFKSLVKLINKDAAMMEFLDTVRNSKAIPNENYARELMELFTLGVKDSAGNDNYTQHEVAQIARAFTGWRFSDDDQAAFFRTERHDFMQEFPERGPKVIFTDRGGFGPGGRDFAMGGEGAAEIDRVVDILFEHTDTDGQNTVARRMARRLFEYFAHGDPDQAAIDAVVAGSGFAMLWNVQLLLRAILVHDEFYKSAAAPPFDAQTAKSVKWPIDYVVSTMRLIKMKLKIQREGGLRLEGGSRQSFRAHLEDMGQRLMDPPSVFGWDWETAWISSATVLARCRFARDVIASRGKISTFKPEKLVSPKLTSPDAILDAVTAVLGVGDQLSQTQRSALLDYLTNGGANPTLDLTDPDVRNAKLNGIFGVLLQ